MLTRGAGITCAAMAITAVAACGGGPTRAPGASSWRPVHMVAGEVRAADGLACRTYVAWSHEPVTDVFLFASGTGTGSSAFVPEAARELFDRRGAAFVTFDKPGVSAPFGDPAAVTIDDAPFARHTEGTLLDCAEGAVRSALARFGIARWHVRGHSEGALLALYLSDRTGAALPPPDTLILSGLPLAPVGDLLRLQLADKPRLARAVEACDWPVMKTALGASCAYFEDAARRPSGREAMERLASRGSKTAIRVFSGTRDANTPVADVRALERWNADTGRLDLTVRYYDGDHRGTPEVRAEIAHVLDALVAP